MTVKDLIRELSKYDENEEVFIVNTDDSYIGYGITEVYHDFDEEWSSVFIRF